MGHSADGGLELRGLNNNGQAAPGYCPRPFHVHLSLEVGGSSQFCPLNFPFRIFCPDNSENNLNGEQESTDHVFF